MIAKYEITYLSKLHFLILIKNLNRRKYFFFNILLILIDFLQFIDLTNITFFEQEKFNVQKNIIDLITLLKKYQL
mgnify:CR=1 FL=1